MVGKVNPFVVAHEELLFHLWALIKAVLPGTLRLSRPMGLGLVIAGNAALITAYGLGFIVGQNKRSVSGNIINSWATAKKY